MARTFEEMAGPELNHLYTGALFLAAGDVDVAEDLLVDTLTGAYVRATGVPADQPRRWLEGELVSTFCGGIDGSAVHAPRPIARPMVAEFLDDVGADALFAAAGGVPPRARAALWLVMLQRWEYAEAAKALDVDRSRLLELLRHRDTLVAAVMRGGANRPSSARRIHRA